MITNIKSIEKICSDYTKVENYDDAAKSKEMYVLHHCAEFRYTVKELKALNRYFNRPPEELIFIPSSLHNGCVNLHIGRVRSYRESKGKPKPHRKKITRQIIKSNATEEIKRLKALQAFYKAVSK